MSIRSVFLLAAMIASGSAWGGTVVVPSDISVSVFAEPNSDLATGQPISFTISATNNGPEPIDNIALVSTEFVDEFDLAQGTANCPGLGLVVANGVLPFYLYIWEFTFLGPLQVSETRTCYITLPVAAQAPDTWEFGFYLPSSYLDIDPKNNSASVTLRRTLGATAPIPVPALSPIALILLASLLAVAVKWALARQATIRSLEDSSWR
jgi:hypothetical protein